MQTYITVLQLGLEKRECSINRIPHGKQTFFLLRGEKIAEVVYGMRHVLDHIHYFVDNFVEIFPREVPRRIAFFQILYQQRNPNERLSPLMGDTSYHLTHRGMFALF